MGRYSNFGHQSNFSTLMSSLIWLVCKKKYCYKTFRRFCFYKSKKKASTQTCSQKDAGWDWVPLWSGKWEWEGRQSEEREEEGAAQRYCLPLLFRMIHNLLHFFCQVLHQIDSNFEILYYYHVMNESLYLIFKIFGHFFKVSSNPFLGTWKKVKK